MLLAFLAVLLVNLLLVANIVTCLLVLTCVVITMVDVAGLMYFWDVDVNFLTATFIILSIGLAVDYSAHIGLAFMKNTGTREERIQKCLVELGSAVFNGGFSNCLALLPLAFSTSYAFKTFFKTFILASLLGLYHGLLFLPVTLSILGPSPYQSALKAKKEEAKGRHEAWSLPVREEATKVKTKNVKNDV
ncbi:patched domain-containing protein 3-like isoform X2 [Symsagittifera roscoffensis]|uniref:patched domain-containing protein 3-like isoform X2 n=1 Tax=Symsagittifera roscoffensis TaxID=84072 RepID=UPI00307B537C